MKLKVITLPFDFDVGGFDDTALQAFQQHREVLHVHEHWAKQRDIFSSFLLTPSFATTGKRPQLCVANLTKSIWIESGRELGNFMGGANPNLSCNEIIASGE